MTNRTNWIFSPLVLVLVFRRGGASRCVHKGLHLLTIAHLALLTIKAITQHSKWSCLLASHSLHWFVALTKIKVIIEINWQIQVLLLILNCYILMEINWFDFDLKLYLNVMSSFASCWQFIICLFHYKIKLLLYRLTKEEWY